MLKNHAVYILDFFTQFLWTNQAITGRRISIEEAENRQCYFRP